MEIRVLDVSEIQEVSDFEKERLEKSIADETDRMFQSWHAPWRLESLEFYLPKGWCFAIRNQNVLKAYFLAQPLLFLRGLTQTLWIEHMAFSNVDTGRMLVELALKNAREKHLQVALFQVHSDNRGLLEEAKAKFLSETLAEIKTSKI